MTPEKRELLCLRKVAAKRAGVRTRARPPRPVQPTLVAKAYERDIAQLVREWAQEVLIAFERMYPDLLEAKRIGDALDVLVFYVRLDARADVLAAFERALEASRERVLSRTRLRQRAASSLRSLANFNLQQMDRTVRTVTGFGYPSGQSTRVGRQLDAAREENVRALERYTRKQQTVIEDLVAQASRRGARIEDLRDRLVERLDVTESTAQRIARDQIFQANAALTQTRMEEIGVDRYVWSTSLDDRVREDHQELEGRTFSFSDPPISDRKTGERANPGEIYNCRCVALPVFDFLNQGAE